VKISVATILVAMAPAVAAADAPKVSLPFLFGVDAALVDPQTSTGFVFGWRPEVIFAWTQPDSAGTSRLGIGVGPYAESVGSFGTHQIWFGGGASVVGYFGKLGVALSGGLDVDFLHAEPSASPVFGLFVGLRPSDLGGVDIPFGIRVDVRPPVFGLPTTIIITAQLDLVLGGVVAFFSAIGNGMR
jgi:hypothetical protein